MISSQANTYLPTELLIKIFKISLFERNHPDIRNLLLVCRQWNHTIMNMPDLWTTVYVAFGCEDDIGHIKAYYEACVERSGNKLLNVTVDAGEYRYVPSNQEDGREEDEAKLTRAAFSHKKLCDILLGPNEMYPYRWQAFHLLPSQLPPPPLPPSETVPTSENQYFDHLFQFPTPNLQSIRITEQPDQLNTFHSFVFRDYIRLLVNTSMLVHVSVTSQMIGWQMLPLFPHLRSLDLCFVDVFNPWYDDLSLLHEDLSSLESLTLRNAQPSSSTIYLPKKEVLLPSLRELAFQGYFGHEGLSYFKLPVLHRLTLIGFGSPISSVPVQGPYCPIGLNVRPKELFWEETGMISNFSPTFLSELRRFLVTCDSVTTMKIPAAAEDAFMKSIRSVDESVSNPHSNRQPSSYLDQDFNLDSRLLIQVLNTQTLDDDSLLMSVVVTDPNLV